MPSSRRSRGSLARRLSDFAVVPVLVMLWEILSRSGVVNPRLFPPPSEVAVTTFSLMTAGFPAGITVWSHIGASAMRIVVGFLIATVIGVPLGVFLGRSPWVRRLLDPVIGFARSIAALALLPLFVVWFGVGEVTRLLLVAYAAFWVIVVNTTAAVLGVDRVYEEAATALGASRSQIFIQVTLMAAMPRIFTGLRVALGIAFLVIVAVEMVGTERGLGALIFQAQTFFRTDIAMSGMGFIALIGLLLASGMGILERVVLPWRKGLEDQR